MVSVYLAIIIYMKINCVLKTTCACANIIHESDQRYIHIKTYCRISSCYTEMSLFLLTTANLSKAAWGRKLESNEQSNIIMVHEAEVLFLPQFWIGSETFPMDEI